MSTIVIKIICMGHCDVSDERKTEQIGIRITKTLRDGLESLAKDDRRKLSAYIELVLEQHVEQAKKGSKKK